MEIAAGSAGIVIVNWQVEQKVMNGAQLAHGCCLLRFRAIACGERLIQLDEAPAQLQLGFHLPAKRVERLPLIRRQRTRSAIEDAQGPERVTVGCHQWGSRIETNMRVAHDQRVLAKTLVLAGVGNHEEILLLDSVGAEGHRTRRLRDRDADARLEPLTVFVHERDERHRRTADVRRQQREIVEAALGFCIEDPISMQGGEA